MALVQLALVQFADVQFADVQLALVQFADVQFADVQLALVQLALVATAFVQLAALKTWRPVAESVWTKASRFSFGFGGETIVDDAAASSSPIPTPGSAPRLVAPAISAPFTWSGVQSGCSASSCAAVPAAAGAENDVPDIHMYPGDTIRAQWLQTARPTTKPLPGVQTFDYGIKEGDEATFRLEGLGPPYAVVKSAQGVEKVR